MGSDVLLDATPLARGHAQRGIGAYTRCLVAALAEPDGDGPRPDLLVTPGQITPAGLRRVQVHWPEWRHRRLPDPFPALSLERRIRGLGPRLFHATQPDLVPDPRRLPVSVTCYDLIPLHEPPRNPLHRAAHRRYVRRLRHAQMILAISQATADDLVQTLGVPADRIRVTPLGVAPPVPAAGETPDAPYVLYANGIEPHKNPMLAIDAVARSRHRVHIVMTGTWDERRSQALRDHARATGIADRVSFLGYVTDARLAALRRDALAALVTSRREGFGLPLLEALAAGVPALAADIPALREVGADAATYLPPDPDRWAAAIDTLVEHPADTEAIERGRRHAASFTWERTAALTRDAWREVLA